MLLRPPNLMAFISRRIAANLLLLLLLIPGAARVDKNAPPLTNPAATAHMLLSLFGHFQKALTPQHQQAAWKGIFPSLS